MGKIVDAYFLAGITVTLLCFASGTSPPIVVPDRNIYGTQRHHFEIHDLTDVSGGKWKAVHIPDEDIQSMLDIANQRNGEKTPLDVQHAPPKETGQEDEDSGVKLPVEVHGRVHMFDHDLMSNKSKNVSEPVGKLIIASENEHRGKDAGPLHARQPSVINLRGFTREEEPKNREMIHRKTSVKPSLIVAKIPEDDDSDNEDDLPIRSLPKPIVASLRKTRPVVKHGAMRSKILAGVMHPPDNPPALLPSITAQSKPTNKNEVTSPQGTNGDPSVLEKIKSILLRSHSNVASSPKSSLTKVLSKSENKPVVIPAQSAQPQNSAPAKVPPANTPPATQKLVKPKKVLPARNNDGLFLPRSGSPADAFSNHASVLNRISAPKKEALLIGIIRALLARDRSRKFSGAGTGLPHYSRQAILQGLQKLQMSKTVGQSQPPLPGSNAGNQEMPSGKNLDEMYQKEREEEVKQELARANEEVLEEKKMRQEESSMLANYERFSNPESHSNWNKLGPQQSQTPEGQVLSMLGPQQLNMLEDNPTAT